MVAGKALVHDGQVLTPGGDALRAGAQVRARKVARRVATGLVHDDMALLEAMGAGQQ
jgi:hypothetical protein